MFLDLAHVCFTNQNHLNVINACSLLPCQIIKIMILRCTNNTYFFIRIGKLVVACHVFPLSTFERLYVIINSHGNVASIAYTFPHCNKYTYVGTNKWVDAYVEAHVLRVMAMLVALHVGPWLVANYQLSK